MNDTVTTGYVVPRLDMNGKVTTGYVVSWLDMNDKVTTGYVVPWYNHYYLTRRVTMAIIFQIWVHPNILIVDI